nr:MAG TPA: hypothetical protein [Caudoviricetes sp.]
MILGPNITGGTSYLPFVDTNDIDNKNPCYDAFRANTYLLTNFYYYAQSVKAYRWADIMLYANLSNFLYGSSNTVQPTSLVLNYVIKY